MSPVKLDLAGKQYSHRFWREHNLRTDAKGVCEAVPVSGVETNDHLVDETAVFAAYVRTHGPALSVSQLLNLAHNGRSLSRVLCTPLPHPMASLPPRDKFFGALATELEMVRADLAAEMLAPMSDSMRASDVRAGNFSDRVSEVLRDEEHSAFRHFQSVETIVSAAVEQVGSLGTPGAYVNPAYLRTLARAISNEQRELAYSRDDFHKRGAHADACLELLTKGAYHLCNPSWTGLPMEHVWVDTPKDTETLVKCYTEARETLSYLHSEHARLVDELGNCVTLIDKVARCFAPLPQLNRAVANASNQTRERPRRSLEHSGTLESPLRKSINASDLTPESDAPDVL